ncbi:hypothetical protein [Streptomyces sp. NPDC048638]|uniref:hypothetical protein n=1 Tax=Streptomyces sp. NPDC048638 TaxID=3365580 RepID=UPI003711F5B0
MPSNEEPGRVSTRAASLSKSTGARTKHLLVTDVDKARFVDAALNAVPVALEAVKDAPAGMR